MKEFKVDYKLHLLVFLLAGVVGYMFYDEISVVLSKIESIVSDSTYFTLAFIGLLLFMVYSMSLIHELLHALAYMIVGGKVMIGFKGMYAYTKETSGMILTSKQFLFVLLLPVTLMSLPAIFTTHYITMFVLIFNLIGSMGDLLMSLFVIKNNKLLVVDSDYGFNMIEKRTA